MTLSLASIHVYPVKSLGGFSVPEVTLTDRGPLHDRRWMLIDANGRFVSQREVPEMAMLHCTPIDSGFRVTDIRDGSHLHLPWALDSGDTMTTTVWDESVHTLTAPAQWSRWFSARSARLVHLVYMPDSALRPVDAAYAQGITSLSDGYPYLIISQPSLDDLNSRLEHSVPMDRFRPNLVVMGGGPFQEDDWREVLIGDARFHGVKTCARCVIPNTDQCTAVRTQEPLRTLTTYRRDGNRILFGMNAMGPGSGTVRVGDLVRPLP